MYSYIVFVSLSLSAISFYFWQVHIFYTCLYHLSTSPSIVVQPQPAYLKKKKSPHLRGRPWSVVHLFRLAYQKNSYIKPSPSNLRRLGLSDYISYMCCLYIVFLHFVLWKNKYIVIFFTYGVILVSTSYSVNAKSLQSGRKKVLYYLDLSLSVFHILMLYLSVHSSCIVFAFVLNWNYVLLCVLSSILDLQN